MNMTKPAAPPFYCPDCKTKYQIVRMESPSIGVDDKIACISCGEPLSGRDGAFILKYFLVNRPEGKRSSRAGVASASH
jgi:hypothetical protein